ncbi:hypothetical protein ScPMuIL_014059 [Solemya velum]
MGPSSLQKKQEPFFFTEEAGAPLLYRRSRWVFYLNFLVFYPWRPFVYSMIRPIWSRFTINLICGSGWKDIALHFDVRFNVNKDKNVIVRNHKANNEWGSEERDIPHFPLIPSTNFDILILCDAAAFKVAVNNQHFIEFAHRIMPPNKIDTLEVSGDVRLTLVRFQ